MECPCGNLAFRFVVNGVAEWHCEECAKSKGISSLGLSCDDGVKLEVPRYRQLLDAGVFPVVEKRKGASTPHIDRREYSFVVRRGKVQRSFAGPTAFANRYGMKLRAVQAALREGVEIGGWKCKWVKK